MSIRELTVMVYGVDESYSHVRVVVRHQNNVEQLLTLWVQLPQATVDRLQSLSQNTSVKKQQPVSADSIKVCTLMSLWVGVTFYFDKGERGPGGEGFVLVCDLVSQILLHPLLLEHLLLALRPEQDARGNGDSHCVLWLWLQKSLDKAQYDGDRERKGGRWANRIDPLKWWLDNMWERRSEKWWPYFDLWWPSKETLLTILYFDAVKEFMRTPHIIINAGLHAKKKKKHATFHHSFSLSCLLSRLLCVNVNVSLVQRCYL